MNKKTVVLKVLLAIFTAINFFMAVVSFATRETVNWLIQMSYGATVALTPQLVHVIRMFGAWNLTFAFLGAMAFANPEKNQIVVKGAVLLLSVRFIEMIIFWSYIVENFAIEPARLFSNACSYLIMATFLWIFRPSCAK